MILPMTTILPLGLLIRPDRNDPQPLVIYHGRNCPDGFAAALAAWRFYQGRAEFLALDHGQITSVDALPVLAGRAVYILDFSFGPELLQAVEARAAQRCCWTTIKVLPTRCTVSSAGVAWFIST